MMSSYFMGNLIQQIENIRDSGYDYVDRSLIDTIERNLRELRHQMKEEEDLRDKDDNEE